MSLHAFELRAEYAPDGDTPFLGGLAALSDGDFNVAEVLEAGGGRIVVDENDAELVTFLDGYPALKRAAIGDTDTPTVRRYDLMDTTAARAEAARRGIRRHGSGTLDDVRAALGRQDQAIVAGDFAAAADVAVGEDPPDEPAPDPAPRRTRARTTTTTTADAGQES
jgi:hypothetical protein